jgi:hypothetical protein
MRSIRHAVVLVALMSALAAGEASAQIPNCGSVTNVNDIWQAGDLKYVEAVFRTQRSITGCLAKVRVEGYINGWDSSYAEGAHTAEFSQGKPVQNYGVNVDSYSHHWWIWLTGGAWENLGSGHDQVRVVPPDPLPPPQMLCEMNGGVWYEDYQWCDNPFSPIIIDTDHNGIRLTSPENGVVFDLNNDGFAEQISWTRPDSDDAWLAMDRNGNGRIDNGSELFGNATPAYADRPEPLSDNGFVALGFAEHPSYGASIADRVIDAQDAIFAKLLLWRDVNHNGVSEPEELQPVTTSSLVAISKEYRLSKRRDRHGNEFRQKGKAWFMTDDGNRMPDTVYDVWLRNLLAPQNTTP